MKQKRVVYRMEVMFGQFFILNCRDRVVAMCSRRLDAQGILEALNNYRRGA